MEKTITLTQAEEDELFVSLQFRLQDLRMIRDDESEIPYIREAAAEKIRLLENIQHNLNFI
jgi:hypothetical protein